MPPAPSSPQVPSNGNSRPAARSGHRRAASSVSIADSPLVQVNAGEPQQFKPKAVALYERLFTEEMHAPGYWVEFFLLPVNQTELARVFREAHPLTEHEVTIQTLVRAAIANMSGPPQDLARPEVVINALRILETVFTSTLTLQTQPSAQPTATSTTSSLIQLLVGIDRAEAVFDELTGRVWALAYHGPRPIARAATQFVLHVASASLGTSLSTLFTTKNFFAAFVRVIDQFVDDVAANAGLTAIGVLAALNQFDDDGANIYQQHIRDFIDETVIAKMIALVQSDLFNYTSGSREPQQESPAASSVSAWISTFWKGSAAESEDNTPKANSTSGRSKKEQGCPTLLPLYQFAVHNSLFASSFATSPALISLIEANARAIQMASRNQKQYTHAWLSLLILRHLVETQFAALVDPNAAAVIHIACSKFPIEDSRRMPLGGIVDAIQVGLKTNASKKISIDWPLYHQLITVLYQVCAQLVSTHTMWPYHWQQLWQTLFSTSRHFTKYAEGASAGQAAHLEEQLLNVIAGMTLRRDALDEEDWSSLFYRVIQSSKMFGDLENAFPQLKKQPPLLAINAMIKQFEVKPEEPDLGLIVRQGLRAAGRHLVSERLPQFSEHREAILKKLVYSQIKENSS